MVVKVVGKGHQKVVVERAVVEVVRGREVEVVVMMVVVISVRGSASIIISSST